MADYKPFTAEDILISLANTPQITFEITDACNLRCEYCGYGKLYSNYDAREHKMLSTRAAHRLIDYLVDLWEGEYNQSFRQNVYISFYGGEPLLNFPFIRDTIEYIERKACKSRSFSFNMTTNALLLQRHIDYLVEKDVKLLISLDGDEEGTSYRVDWQGRNAYQRIVENVRYVQEKYPRFFDENVSFNAVLHNRNSVEGIHSYFKSQFSKKASIGELNSVGVRPEMRAEFLTMYQNKSESMAQASNRAEIEEDMFLQSAGFRRATQYLMRESEFVYHDYNELLYGKRKRKPEETYLTGTCMPFSRKVFVTVNGKLLPCETIGHEHALGQISDSELDIDFAKIASVYNAHFAYLHKQCKACGKRKTCGQCIFTIDGMEKHAGRCEDCMSAMEAQREVNSVMTFFQEHPTAYDRIMREVIFK